MELLLALLKQAADEGNIHINVDFNEKIEQIVSDLCFQILLKIHGILNNTDLSDFDCIEEIICLLEKNGFDGGSRHDF